jgi:hypothetical protein
MVTWIPEGPDAGLTPFTTGAVGAGGGVVFTGVGVGLGMGEGPTVMTVGVVWPLGFFVAVGGVTSTPWVPTVFPAVFPVPTGK